MTNISPKSRILVLFAHPAFEKSRVHRRLVDAIRNLEGVTFHDLYEAYPEFEIDVRREQELLTDHDIVVLQHPFFWYSTPALVKQWEDLVLEHGWAYGSHGKALAGKIALSVISAGGREDAYQHGGHNRFTMRELLAPIEQTFVLCGMRYLPPFIVHGTHRMSEEKMVEHANDYRRTLTALREGDLELEAVQDHPRLNWRLEEVLKGDSETS